MKIFYISQVGIPSTAAQAVGTMHICEAFANLGIETTLIVKNKFWERPPDGCEGNVWDFYGVDSSFKIEKILAPPRFPSWFQKRALAKVDANDSILYTRSVTLAALATALGYRVVVEFHDSISSDEEKKLNRSISSPYFSGVVVITEALRRYYEKRAPLLAGQIVVAPDAAKQPKTSEKISFENSAQLQVGYVGQLYQGRGLEIIQSMSKSCPWAYFHIIGGIKSDIGYWEKKFQLLSNVKFYGFLPYCETDKYRQSFDVLLAPYLKRVALGAGKGNTVKWMSPIKIFEYMSAAKPMIVSDLPVLKEVLENGKNALLCDPEDIKSWIKALERLRDDSDLASRIGLTAYKEFKAKYTWQARAKHIIEGLNLKN